MFMRCEFEPSGIENQEFRNCDAKFTVDITRVSESFRQQHGSETHTAARMLKQDKCFHEITRRG